MMDQAARITEKKQRAFANGFRLPTSVAKATRKKLAWPTLRKRDSAESEWFEQVLSESEHLICFLTLSPVF